MSDTAQTKGSGQTGSASGSSPGATSTAEDLVDDRAEDKDDAEIWNEIEEAERAADSGEPAGDTEQKVDAVQTKVKDESEEETDGADGGATPNGEDRSSDDLWKNATAEQKAAFEATQAQVKKLEQSERSQRGRVSALQHQLNELQRRSPGKENGAATKGSFQSERGKSFQKEYPEVAAPVAEEIEVLRKELTEAKDTLASMAEDRRKAAILANEETLEEVHPKWESELRDDEGRVRPEFTAWLKVQPRHIQEAAARNGNDIVDAEEAADVVGRFKAFRSSQGSSPSNDSPNADQNGGKGTGNSLSGKRQRQLEASSAARSTGPGAANGIPEDGDPETLWKAFDEQERRQARSA
jgi:hypothetical protein